MTMQKLEAENDRLVGALGQVRDRLQQVEDGPTYKYNLVVKLAQGLCNFYCCLSIYYGVYHNILSLRSSSAKFLSRALPTRRASTRASNSYSFGSNSTACTTDL